MTRNRRTYEVVTVTPDFIHTLIHKDDDETRARLFALTAMDGGAPFAVLTTFEGKMAISSDVLATEACAKNMAFQKGVPA